MITAIVSIVIFISLIYLFKTKYRDKLDKIEPFVNTSPNVDMQTVHELISDRDGFFKFTNSRFVYLDSFDKRMQKSLKRLAEREKEIGDFIKHHKKNVRFLQKMRSNTKLIKPVYTKRDLASNKSKVDKIKRFYQHHLKQYLKLYNLNNLILVQQIYCGEKCPSLSKRLVDTIKTYKTLKTRFNKEFAEILDDI